MDDGAASNHICPETGILWYALEENRTILRDGPTDRQADRRTEPQIDQHLWRPKRGRA